MRGAFIIHAMLGIMFLFSSNAYAKNNERIEYLSVTGLNFPPYILRQEDGKIDGIVVRILRTVAADLNVDMDFNITNWARAFENVKKGRKDVLIPTMYSIERSKFFHFPKQHLIEFNVSLFKHIDGDIKYSGHMEELKNYRIGKIRNGRVAPIFDRALESGVFSVEERNSVSLLAHALGLKRLDLIVTDTPTLVWIARREKLSQIIQAVDPPLGKVRSFMAFSKEKFSKEQVIAFDRSLSRLHANGTVDIYFKEFLNIK